MDRELLVVPAEPDDAWGVYAQMVLDITLLRRTTARNFPYSDDLMAEQTPSGRAERRTALARRLRLNLNGCWSRGRLEHFCMSDECDHIKEVTDTLTATLNELFPSGAVQENKVLSHADTADCHLM